MSLFVAAPFIGQALGSTNSKVRGRHNRLMCGHGFLGDFTRALSLLGMAAIPEACAPVLSYKEHKNLSQQMGKVYKSKLKIETGPKFPIRIFRTTLARPWLLLYLEPVLSVLATHITIVDRTQYMLLWHISNCVPARAWVE